MNDEIKNFESMLHLSSHCNLKVFFSFEINSINLSSLMLKI